MKFDDATSIGMYRQYLPECPHGRNIQILMDNVRPFPYETAEAFDARFEKAARVLTEGEDCLDVPSCIQCARGQGIVSDRAQLLYGTDPNHSLTLLDLYSRTGDNRYFPNTCQVGRQMNQIMGSELENRAEIADQIARSFGCNDVLSCAHCEIGRDLIQDLLLELAEFGMDCEAGYFLRDMHMWLV